MLTFVLCGCNQRVTPAEELTYEMVDGEVTITGYLGTARELVLPQEIEGRPVTEIGAYAFAEYDMTSIELPDTLIEIGAYAFTECNCLTEIKIPENVEAIGEGAFYHCDVLRKVELPEGLKRIEVGAFNSCVVLENINITDNLEYIGAYALGYCDKLLENRCAKRPTVVYYEFSDGWDTTQKLQEYTYDSNGSVLREVSVSEESETVLEFKNEYGDDRIVKVAAYDENGELVYVETYDYHEDGKTVTTEYTQGHLSVEVYNTQDQVVSFCWKDEEGNISSYLVVCYSHFGKISYTSNGSNSHYTELVCNEFGEVIEQITYDSNGNEYERSTCIRDENGDLLEVIEIDAAFGFSSTTKYVYD